MLCCTSSLLEKSLQSLSPPGGSPGVAGVFLGAGSGGGAIFFSSGVTFLGSVFFGDAFCSHPSPPIPLPRSVSKTSRSGERPQMPKPFDLASSCAALQSLRDS